MPQTGSRSKFLSQFFSFFRYLVISLLRYFGSSSQMRINQFQQFFIHSLRLLLLSAAQRLRRAMMQVVFHQIPRHPAQRFLHRSDLRDDVRTVAVFLDHFLQAAHLPLDAPQPLAVRFLQFRVDAGGLAPVRGAFASAIGSRFIAPARSGAPGRVLSWISHDSLHPYISPYPLWKSSRALPCPPPP